MTIVPSELSPGDTAEIILEKRYEEYPEFIPEDVTYEPFPSFQLFNVKIEKGKEYGTILNTALGDTSDEFTDIEQGFKFIAADSIGIDRVDINIRVSTIIDNSGIIASASVRKGTEIRIRGKEDILKSFPKIKTKNEVEMQKSNSVKGKVIVNSVAGVSPPSAYEEIFGIGKAVIGVEHTILLGETKYFQAKYNQQENRLKIEEIKPDADRIPQQKTGIEDGWEWITADVWGDNPVGVVECDSCGKKMGVYWEKKYPTNQFEDIKIGKKKYRTVKMDSLDSGLIRILGRYWTLDSIYTVNLKAHYNNDSADIKITVNKPTRLGDTFSHTIDVFGVNLNVDSLIIKYCGESGISTYLTKGQMFQEAKKVGGEFKPSYRYEPFYEVFNIRKAGKTNQYFNSNLPFVVSSSGMGSGDPIPTIHTNVYPISYPMSPIKIGQFFYNNFNEYKKNLSDGTIKIVGSDNMTKRWNQLYDYYIDTLDCQLNFAKQKAIDSLRIEIRDGLLDTLFLEYAQTRKVASYGFLQILGITPPDKGYYSKNDPTKSPEKINDQDILMPMYIWLIKKNLKTSMNDEEPINNWPRGYEAELTRSLFYYNTDMDYAKSLYNNSKDFKPEN